MMKKLCVLLILLFGFVACGGGGPDDSSDSSGISELSLNQTSTGSIDKVGEVDWYHFNAVEANNVLQIQCDGDQNNPPLEYLVQVYEKDDNGDYVRVWGSHAPEDAALPANITMNIPINTPRNLYISVRDLLDDEASSQHHYRLQLAYTHEAVDNETFAQATELGVDDSSTCATDNIGEIGDVDCYHFTIASDGVYAVETEFDIRDSSSVRLEIKLYDDAGTLIHSASGVNVTQHFWNLYLESGEYYVVVHDQGRDDMDGFSFYNICVNSVDADEVVANDTSDTNETLTPDPSQTVTASLEYQQDQDWYGININDPSGDEFQTIILTFNDLVDSGITARFEIVMLNPNGDQIINHIHPNGAAQYTVQFQVDPGLNLLAIRPANGANVGTALGYEFTVEVAAVDDPDELVGDGNDGIAQADDLVPPSSSATGKIGFRGDVDWYKVAVPDSDDQVLSIRLEAAEVSDVEYCVDIMNGSTVWTLSDTNGLDVATQLETSFFVPASTSEEDLNYYIRVGDCQADDGDDVNYTLSIAVDAMRTAMTDFPGPNSGGKDTVYFSEAMERDLVVGEDKDTAAALAVKCIIYPQYDPEFKADNQLLKVTALDDHTYISDWIAGYIDYRGDQDWFVLDIKSMLTDGAVEYPEDWYYDIQIRMYSPGSDVEYAWKLYRDRGTASTPPNGVVIERTPGVDRELANYVDSDGIMAAWATSLITGTPGVIDTTVPDEGVDFWIGNEWQNDWYYLSISDFNYVYSGTNELNTVPDDDWGYVAPYYFQVQLTFHPGVSNPE